MKIYISGNQFKTLKTYHISVYIEGKTYSRLRSYDQDGKQLHDHMVKG